MLKYDVVIASDHAGVKLKKKIINLLSKKDFKVKDFGTDSDERVDYPDYAKHVTESIEEGFTEKGILICGTGIGMSIAANRSTDIRAALCLNETMATKSREHNNANILVLGSKITEDKLSLKMVDIFLNTKFDGGRHSKRLAKIS